MLRHANLRQHHADAASPGTANPLLEEPMHVMVGDVCKTPGVQWVSKTGLPKLLVLIKGTQSLHKPLVTDMPAKHVEEHQRLAIPNSFRSRGHDAPGTP